MGVGRRLKQCLEAHVGHSLTALSIIRRSRNLRLAALPLTSACSAGPSRQLRAATDMKAPCLLCRLRTNPMKTHSCAVLSKYSRRQSPAVT